jgi:UDP-GlcNAc:undecaprenyl-phosphate GlcNAc-1-phosphate transferase
MPLTAACLFTFVLSLVLTPAARTLAQRTGLVARPRRDRWHTRSTALLGGIAIQLAFLGGYLLFQPEPARTRPLVAIAGFAFASGLLDDVRPLRPSAKLATQLVAAAATVALGFRLPWTSSVLANDLLTVAWLVGITNAVNLLDNMDGLAAGIAVIACGFLAVTFQLNGQLEMALMPTLLAGAVLGFLVFNAPPASIFMGDCGATFVGALLGRIALLSDYGRSRNLTAVLLAPVLILIIPILDTSLVTVTRKLAGRPVSVGGRDHASHRLVALGLSERWAVATLWLLAILSGTFALVVRFLADDALLVLLPAFAVVFGLFALWLGRVDGVIPRRSDDMPDTERARHARGRA